MSRTAKTLVIGLAIAVVVVVAGAALLMVYAPWRPHSGPTDRTFTLDRGVGVTIAVPSDWRATEHAVGAVRAVTLLPAGVGTVDAATAAVTALRDGTGTEPVHVVDVSTAAPERCAAGLAVGGSLVQGAVTSSDGRATVIAVRAQQRLAGACLVIEGRDYDTSAPLPQAGDLVRRMVDDQALTVTAK